MYRQESSIDSSTRSVQLYNGCSCMERDDVHTLSLQALYDVAKELGPQKGIRH